MARQSFYKGHGTGNDFVLIEDQHAMHRLEPADVAALCDRHTGIGADGLLRIVRARHIEGWDGDPRLWFMDYRNADGSIAEMCGNGLRVYARHLINEQLVPVGPFDVATRAGIRHVELDPSGEIATSMGTVGFGGTVTLTHAAQRYRAYVVDVGNPHAVTWIPQRSLEELDLSIAPGWEPAEVFPHGVNIEFAAEISPGQLQMRVFERGAGETLSCGTGVVATAALYREQNDFNGPITVQVPGGELVVTMRDDQAWLLGPAVVTMRGEFFG